METVDVGGSYESVLAGLTPKEYVREPRPGTFELAQPFTVPPLNTDIRFAAALPAKHLSESQYLTVAASPLPERWDWRHPYDIDDAVVAKKKQHLTKVPTQGMCGSCWAVAVAGLVGDLFVTAGIVETNPDVSATYSLACYPQHQCGGGNPAALLGEIEAAGIGSNKCVDYSWCMDDAVCAGKSTQHFNAGTETQRLNGIIPQCGCYTLPQTLYYVKDASVVTMENDNHDVGPLIRSHIFRIGPVIGGYHVFANFMSGNYAATDGIYFENYDYETDRWLTPNESPQWVGSHAIVVLGWGVSEPINIPLPDGRAHEARVPYWYCRNSWGEGWGFDGGYFRIAAYPYNRRSQFERMVVIQPQNMLSGGFMICSPDRTVASDRLGKIVRQRVATENFDAAMLGVDDPEAHYWMIAVLLAVLLVAAFAWSRAGRA